MLVNPSRKSQRTAGGCAVKNCDNVVPIGRVTELCDRHNERFGKKKKK